MRTNVKRRFVSHRLRGFDTKESTVVGLSNALEKEIQHLEVDLRLTADNKIIVYHDSTIRFDDGQLHRVRDVKMADITKNKNLTHISLLSDFLGFYAENCSSDCTTLLHLDVKYSGFEVETLSIIRAHLSLNRVVFVSWVPEFLLELSRLEPAAVICFSHISTQRLAGLSWIIKPIINNRSLKTLNALVSIFSKELAMKLNSIDIRYTLQEGESSLINSVSNIAFVSRGNLTEKLFSIIAENNGYVCLPRICLSRGVINKYRKAGIKVASYSYISFDQIEAQEQAQGLDLYYVDNAQLFE